VVVENQTDRRNYQYQPKRKDMEIPAHWHTSVPKDEIWFVYTDRGYDGDERYNSYPESEPIVLFPGDTVVDVVVDRLNHEPLTIHLVSGLRADPKFIERLVKENETTESAVAHVLALAHACGAKLCTSPEYDFCPDLKDIFHFFQNQEGTFLRTS